MYVCTYYAGIDIKGFPIGRGKYTEQSGKVGSFPYSNNQTARIPVALTWTLWFLTIVKVKDGQLMAFLHVNMFGQVTIFRQPKNIPDLPDGKCLSEYSNHPNIVFAFMHFFFFTKNTVILLGSSSD